MSIEKLAATAELVDQGLDFDTAVDLVKEANLGGVAGALLGLPGGPIGGVAGVLNSLEKSKQLKRSGGSTVAHGAGQFLASSLPLVGAISGARAGSRLQKRLNEEHEKTSALNTLLDQGLDFDTAVDLIKEASDGINIKPSHKGELHEELGVPAGQKIPASKLQAAAHSPDPAERKRAVFAINAKRWNHKKAAVQELLESGVDVESAIAFAEEAL